VILEVSTARSRIIINKNNQIKIFGLQWVAKKRRFKDLHFKMLTIVNLGFMLPSPIFP
jgi:uncharacterized membrane protein